MDVTKPLFTWVATEFSGMDISKLMLMKPKLSAC